MMSTPGDSSIPAIIQESLARSAKNLQALKNSLDATRLAKVAKRLFEARRVVAFAADSASILAEYLEYHLSIAGTADCRGHDGGRNDAPCARGDENATSSLRSAFREACGRPSRGRSRHGRMALIASGFRTRILSPLARICDDVFLAAVEAPSFGRSYTAPISLLDALIATCGQYQAATDHGGGEGNRGGTEEGRAVVQPLSEAHVGGQRFDLK